MNKFFTAAVAALSICAADQAFAQDNVEPKDIKYIGIEFVPVRRQTNANMVETAAEAIFGTFNIKAAAFENKKTGLHTFMNCDMLILNRIGATQQGHNRKFVRQLDQATHDLKCGSPA